MTLSLNGVMHGMSVQANSNRIMAIPLILLAAMPASAQSDPASLERTIPKFNAPPATDRLGVATPTLPPSVGARIASRFVLGAVNIDGATVFGSEELAQSYESLLASEIGRAELDAIVARITARYRQAGYFLSYASLPEQSVQSGIVGIRVVEGYVGDVRVEGSDRSTQAVQQIAKQLVNDRPLRTATLERVLGLIRDLPGLTVVETRISRSPADPARHELTIVLGSDPARALVYTDNRGTIDGARLRGYSSLSLASLVVPGDQLQLDLFAIPSRNFRFIYGQAKMSLPIGFDGLRLFAAHSRGAQYQRLDGPNQRGTSRQSTAEIVYPFVKSRSFSLVGHASLSDIENAERKAGSTIQHDRLNVARAWLEFANVGHARVDGRIGVSQGVSLGNITGKRDPLSSRLGASGRFTKFNVDAQLNAPLSEQFSVRIDTSAQYSTEPLLAAEEFGLGGNRIGRAFDFNDMTGDHGFGVMLELSRRLGDYGHIKQLEIFTYVDGGAAFRNRRVADLPENQWLTGVGGGARLSLFGLSLSGEVGAPLVDRGNNHHLRAFASASKVF